PDQPILAPLASLRAFLRVGQALVFSEERIASYAEARYEAFRQMGVPSELFDASIAYGDLVAEEVLTWASSDYYLETRSYPKFTVTGEPGVWQPTPPAYMDGVEPHWREIRPFVLDSAAQFSPPPPPPYSVEEGSPFMELVEEVYEVGNELTYEQRAIASFWDCNPYVMHTRGHVMFATKKITPGGHWIGIAGHASRATDADFVSTARTYALTAIALSDAFISAWDEKYRSNLVRPETVINEHIDPDWIPLLQTPPFPEHTSGHSVISAAAATVLTNLYGPKFAFDDTTEVRYGLPVRSFASFEAAAEEAAVSRLYGGIHYRPAIDDGFVQGGQVGQLALQELIEPELAASPESTVSPAFTVSQAVSE
ncbi:MAG: vanadium-dependent haloperoxidase, partial [Bacteroidota bacterium]